MNIAVSYVSPFPKVRNFLDFGNTGSNQPLGAVLIETRQKRYYAAFALHSCGGVQHLLIVRRKAPGDWPRCADTKQIIEHPYGRLYKRHLLKYLRYHLLNQPGMANKDCTFM